MQPAIPCSSIKASRASRSRYAGRELLQVPPKSAFRSGASGVTATEVLVERAGLHPTGSKVGFGMEPVLNLATNKGDVARR